MGRSALLLTLALSTLAQTSWAQDPAPAPVPENAPITKLPALTKQVDAIYPERALRDRIESAVVLEIDLSATGEVLSLDVISSSTIAEDGTATGTTAASYGFVASATTAVSQMEFTPAEAGGQPVAVRIPFTYRFNLPPPPAPPPPPSETSSVSIPEVALVVNFQGTLRERGTRRRLPGVIVTVFRGEGEATQGFEATSNDDGEFKFFNLPAGNWRVLAQPDGYYPFRTAEEVTAGEITDVTYYLEKGSYNPYDVVVEAKRVKKEVNRRTLTVAEIVKVPGTLGDPILVVENLPGVARPQAGTGLIIVRGSGPQSTGVYIDTINVPLIYHFGGLKSVVPAAIIETIDFYPGNYSVFYGRRTGGVFDAHIKRLNPDQVHGSVDISLLDAGAYIEVPILDNLSIALAGRRSYIDVILNAAIPDDSGVNLIQAPRYYDYQAIVDWRPAEEHSVRSFFLGSNDSIRLLFEDVSEFNTQLSSNSASASTGFHRLVTTWEYTPIETFSNEFRISVGNDIVDFDFLGIFEFQIDSLPFQLRDTVRWQFSDNLTFTTGVDAELLYFDIFVKAPLVTDQGDGGMGPMGTPDLDEVRIVDNENVTWLNTGLFVEAELKLDNLLLVPGFRADFYMPVDKFGLDPRIVARYTFGDELTLKGGVGMVHEAPQPNETSTEFGTPDLGLEGAVQYSVGGEYQPTKYFSIDATFFYNRLFDQVSASPDPLVNYDNNGTGEVFGMELFIRHKFHKNFQGWLSYTLMRAERTDSGETEARLFDFDQTHIFNIVASYVFPANWEAGLRWRVISGNPTTPITGAVWQDQIDEYSPVFGPTNSGRLSTFHQLDLRVEKRWIYDIWTFAAYISLTNAYNQANTEGLNYNFDYSRSAPVTGLPIFPILGVRGEL